MNIMIFDIVRPRFSMKNWNYFPYKLIIAVIWANGFLRKTGNYDLIQCIGLMSTRAGRIDKINGGSSAILILMPLFASTITNVNKSFDLAQVPILLHLHLHN